MYSERYPKRKRRITARMRLALIICAVLAAAIPLIEYLASKEEVRMHEQLSGRLITATSRAAELNGALVGLSGDTENISSLQTVEEVNIKAEEALSMLSQLRQGFSQEFSQLPAGTEAGRITELLDQYRDALSNVAARRVEELSALERFSSNRDEINGLLRHANTELLTNISMVSALFERRLTDVGVQNPSNEMIGQFRDLTLFREIRRLLQDVERQIGSLDPANLNTDTSGIASQYRFAMRGASTRVAKITDVETRQVIARDMSALDRSLLGSDGIVTAINQIMEHRNNVVIETAEREVIADELLTLSAATLAISRQEAEKGGQEFAQLAINSRRLVLLLSSALLAILLGLLFFSVGRVFAKRMDRLTDGVLAIANGELTRDIHIGGNDELTAMGEALEIFRENSQKLVQSNEALETRSFEIRELSIRLQTILDTTQSGIVAFDQQGQIALANPPARHFLGGINHQTPFAWPDAIDFLDGNDLSPLEASLNPVNRVLAGQRIKNELALMEQPDALSGRYVRISSSIVADSESPINSVIVLEDVTEAEQNRQRVERTGRLDALGQLTGGVAHDFNNLLATIEYALELSLSGGVSDQAKVYLNTAIGSVRRGSELTARLLSFAKRQPGLARAQSIDEVLKEFRTLVEPSIAGQIDLKFEVVDPSIFVHCDTGQLENALLNLVLNSRDAILGSGQGDQIAIAVRKLTDPVLAERKGRPKKTAPRNQADRAYVEVSVRDNGPGMSDEVQRRALDPFFSTKNESAGSGLGLSMVYGFVENSNGEMNIYSEEGSGTVVRLLIPEGLPEHTSLGDGAELPMPKGDGEHVLIVEDNDELRVVIADIVRTLGYTVTVASSGEEAMEILTDRSVCDLVLSDVVMPGGMGGFDLGAELRNLWSDIPLVYMSGYAGFTEAEMGIAKGRLVQKPCSPSELSIALRDALAELEETSA